MLALTIATGIAIGVVVIVLVSDIVDHVGYEIAERKRKRLAGQKEKDEKERALKKRADILTRGILELAMLPDEEGDREIEKIVDRLRKELPPEKFEAKMNFLNEILILIESNYEVEALLEEWPLANQKPAT